jgi:signal transduction histidine kinase/CheY-like chemotaxis protein/HPt (histidine-containing phosphotransfer) domain-containing protein
MIFTVTCILLFSVLSITSEMRRSGDDIYNELEKNAEESVRQELRNLVRDISNYVLALEIEIDRSMLNAALVLYELDRLSGGTLTLEDLEDIKERTGMSDLYIGDLDGVFTLSTEPGALGLSLFDIWDGYRMLVTGQANYIPSDLKVKAETGEIFKFTAITRADNRGVLESALDASVVEEYLQSLIENNKSIRAINLFDSELMTLTSNYAPYSSPVYIKGRYGTYSEALINSFFVGFAEIHITLNRQDAQIYFPVIEDSGRVRYVLYIDFDTTVYFSTQDVVEETIIELVQRSVFLKTFSLFMVFAVLLIFTVIISIITKKLVAKLEEMLIATAASNKAKSSFLSTMSHEIRTPMNAILGVTEIYLQNEKLEHNVKDGLEKIYTSGDMLLRIINDVLDLSKIEAGKLELITAEYKTVNLIADIAQLNMMKIGKKPIEFVVQADENLPAGLVGDELRIKQIMNYILSNAFKYTSEGTVKLTIFSDAAERNPGKSGDAVGGDVNLYITVSDTGQGMSKEQVDTLFDENAHFSMEANRTSEGTGLGLNITRSLVSMMDGSITVESELGKGSIFAVRLPQGVASSDVLGKEMAEDLRDFRLGGGVQLKREQLVRDPMPYGSVLIVDDVETNIFVASGLMMPYELQIDTADSGFAAIEKIKSGKVYDVVFMDHMMPGMDGIETTKLLRDTGYIEPIVALTANALAGQAEEFLDNGFDGFLSKPIDIHNLNDALNKFIRDKQSPEVIEAAREQAKAKGNQADIAAAASQSFANPKLVESFLRDANKSLATLDAIIETGVPYSDKDLRNYIIHIHGMKSALANMGKMELSDIAMKLEKCGRANEVDVIAAESPAFLVSLREFVSEVTPAEEAVVAVDSAQVDMSYLSDCLAQIKTSCDEFDEYTIEELLKELNTHVWTQEINDLLRKISEMLLHSDFDEIVEAIDEFL